MKKNVRVTLIVVAALIGAYLVYRWYMNQQANGNTSPTGALGTNLNSVAPELVGGSTGPSSGLTYTPGPTTINLTLPNGGPTQTTVTPHKGSK